jgi:hypothetical protein
VGELNDFGFRSFMNTVVFGAFRHHNDFGGPALVQAIASSWWPAHGLPHGPIGVHKADCPPRDRRHTFGGNKSTPSPRQDTLSLFPTHSTSACITCRGHAGPHMGYLRSHIQASHARICQDQWLRQLGTGGFRPRADIRAASLRPIISAGLFCTLV